MRYKDRDELVAGLREVADFIEAHGVKLPIDRDVLISNWLWGSDAFETRVKLREIAKTLGRATKNHSGSYFDISRDFGPVTLKWTAARDAVCTPKVIGKKIVPAVEARPEREVDDIEWVCTDPILKAS